MEPSPDSADRSKKNVVVADRDPHARFLSPVLAVRAAGDRADLFEGPVTPVAEHEVRVEVVGDVYVGESVAVEVRRDDAEAAARKAGEPGGLRRVLEPGVAESEVEDVVLPGVHPRLTVEPERAARTEAHVRVGLGLLHVVHHVEVEDAVEIGVEKGAPRAPPRIVDAGRRGDLVERAVAAVSEQAVRSVSRHVEIVVPVAVHVGGDDAHSPALSVRESGHLGHVLESEIAEISVEVIGSKPVQEKEIEPAVAVGVQETDAGAHHFLVLLLPGGAVRVHEIDTGRRRDVAEVGSARAGGRHREENCQKAGYAVPRSHSARIPRASGPATISPMSRS